MVLSAIARGGDVVGTMRGLLEENHEPRSRQRELIRQALAIYRTLLAADVVERVVDPDTGQTIVRLTVDLQPDFALNQVLSPFALAVVELLDPEAPGYALDVVSVVESILEDPRPILGAQEAQARGEAVAAMKADGIEYEERMALLEDITYPKPLAELLSAAFETYRRSQPWVGDTELRPKSVVRDMYERAMSFGEYVAYYRLSRSEGLVLRYLSDAYRVLRQTVPDDAKTEEVRDIIEWLGELVRQTDSSVLDEWEALAAGLAAPSARSDAPIVPPAPRTLTSNVRAFRILVRNELFRRVQLAAREAWGELGELDSASGWDADRWEDALADYFDEYDSIGTGPEARSSALLVIEESPGAWRVQQILDDPAGDHDWRISGTVDLAESDELGSAALRITSVSRV